MPMPKLFGSAHVKAYEESDGAVGWEWEGVRALILTTTGRKSGEERPTPLIYGEAGGAPVIVASKGGADEPPAWYLNLLDEPDVGVQVGPDRFRAHARVASDEEKPGLWTLMAGIWPAYDDYQASTDRPIPVVVLDRI